LRLANKAMEPGSERRWVRGCQSRSYLAAAVSLVLVGFALRLAWAMWFTGAIELEGAEYARIAQNLRSGVGYVGIATPGQEVLFPPLFPILIATSSFVVGDYEWAGRIVSIMMGSLLPVAVLGVASRLFGRKTGFVAAGLAVCHPLLVNLSACVYSEGPYATLVLTATYLTLRAMDTPSRVGWTLAGGAFAAAYLLRSEAIAPFAVALAFALLGSPGVFRARLGRTVVLSSAFLAPVLPYVVFLYWTTGQTEGKAAINFAIGSRLLSGQSEWQVGYAISDSLRGIGIWMRPHIETIRETPIQFGALARVVAAAVRHNVPALLGHLSAPWLGAPLLPGLALVGIVRRPWPPRVATANAFVLMAAIGTVAVPMAVYVTYPRHYFILVSFLVVWAASGLVVVARWGKGTIRHLRVPRRCGTVLGTALSVAAGALVVGVSYRDVGDVIDLRLSAVGTRSIKEIGRWIGGQQTGRVRIIDVETNIAFHAQADYVHFPDGDSTLALRYLDAAQVDYIVLRSGGSPPDYYRQWLTSGVPSDRAQLVYSTQGKTDKRIVVFRWRRGQESGLDLPVPLSMRKDATVAPGAATSRPPPVPSQNAGYLADGDDHPVLQASSDARQDFLDSRTAGQSTFDYDAYLNAFAEDGDSVTRFFVRERTDGVPWAPHGGGTFLQPPVRTGARTTDGSPDRVRAGPDPGTVDLTNRPAPFTPDWLDPANGRTQRS
jgi:4-amino-4-deoxy-L-arabinose transferase-like glycosyltransferase